jgi:hypothetical protein
MSGLPAAAFAVSNGIEGGVNAEEAVRAQAQRADVSASVTAGGEVTREQQKQNAEVSREQQKQQLETAREQQKQELEASSTNQIGEENEQEIDLELEDDEDVAFSLDDLKQKIENRKHELEDEEASTTPKFKEVMKNANEVRLAVHSLLASKELLGGIGFQVSEIAKEMNDSVATTTNVEAKIQSRGFLMRLLFGGDRVAAEVITEAVAQNQQRIDDLNKLLGEANVSAGIQVVLKAQIAAIQDAQARLQDLAQKEQKMWGFFSWRF